MTLKELRISKGLSQEMCAKYLGIGLRTYQNYENDSAKINSLKYNIFMNKLFDYSSESLTFFEEKINYGYYTNVITGGGIFSLSNQVKNLKKRDCYRILEKYIYGDYNGKICILYGLRRTGKTALLFQMIGELVNEMVAYIKIKTTDTMANLTKDLNKLFNNGYKYVFIDEITLLDDFINTAAVLSDIYSQVGMKIVASGTDSLGFMMANRDELYDRCIMIHTSFIPFKEYERLLGILDVDKYIEYGGTLKIENMTFDDPDYMFDEVSFRDDESTRKYIDSAISRNIQNTLKNDNYGIYFNQLKEIYDNGELTNVINRIVENMNHNFLLKTIEDDFRSHDLGSAKDLLLHNIPNKSAYILTEVDEDKIIDRLKNIIEVKEKEDLKIKINEEHIEKIKKYLIMLDLIINCPDIYESGKKEDHYIFTQPGMRYSIAKALVYSLMQDEYFNSNSELDKNIVINKILEDVKGKMLEEIVLLETVKSLPKNKKAFKFKFDMGGEFDMVIYDNDTNTSIIYEIKHSDKIVDKQMRYLLDEEKLSVIKNRYGNIKEKIVIYRGEDKILENGIKYLNVEKYLLNL